MDISKSIVTDPAQYGSKGQLWHPDFVAYMISIYEDPVYRDMPDALKEDGKIQWEAPSNRSGGRYQYTHQKRAAWWKAKATELGINTNSNGWISKTAKKIHPFGEKPCKRCGRVMRIAYSYPNYHIKQRLKALYGNAIEFDPLEPIDDLLVRIVNTLGEPAFDLFPKLLTSKSIEIPQLQSNLNVWLKWIEEEYIPKEPSVLSPGAMSNPPDRFDGFHSFNLCCRKLADSGRSAANLRSYTTDRRVFEYWSEGNWIAADRLMGIINSLYRDEPSADGGAAPSTADHIGPLSLGFMHRPEFRLLSKAANSAKNNRMALWDVNHLISVEKSGENVVSWHAKHIWDLRKHNVQDDEKALRLSKLLRDNQRNSIHLFYEVFKEGHLLFLASLLNLEHADYKVDFNNLRIVDFVTKFDELELARRETKYVAEQKARRVRIGFDALHTYGTKLNRHNILILKTEMTPQLQEALKILDSLPEEIKELDKKLHSLLKTKNETELRTFVVEALSPERLSHPHFINARHHLELAMNIVATHLSTMWEDDRYVRAPFDFEVE
jgi:Alw26I/Eco31I/Esp3I family type II restriction endonuclease